MTSGTSPPPLAVRDSTDGNRCTATGHGSTMRAGEEAIGVTGASGNSDVPGRGAAWPRLGEPVDLTDQLVHGRYTVGHLLGEGGDALVYLAHDRDLGRSVALKLLRPELRADPTFVERFE